MTTVYYSDSTPPAAYPGEDYGVGIAKFAAGNYDRVDYALWVDDVTWDGWVSWAKQNMYVTDAETAAEEFRTGTYSSLALKIRGYWDTIAEGDFSFMCIAGASDYGAVCVEAFIEGSNPPTTLSSKTFRIP